MRRRAHMRGLTLVEVLVSVAVLSMIATLIYGTFDSLSHAKKGEAQRGDRTRQARAALDRIAREMQSAYLSMHSPAVPILQTRATGYIAKNGSPFDRVDFNAFAHVRTEREARESDQAEIGYFVLPDPEKDGKNDLVRREQTPPDMDPQRGGIVSVLCEDVESFDVRYFEPVAAQWIDNWDSSQITGQLNRLPLEVKVTIVLKNAPSGVQTTYATKFTIPIQQPLSFGIPR